jgi:hypothetical protein
MELISEYSGGIELTSEYFGGIEYTHEDLLVECQDSSFSVLVEVSAADSMRWPPSSRT